MNHNRVKQTEPISYNPNHDIAVRDPEYSSDFEPVVHTKCGDHQAANKEVPAVSENILDQPTEPNLSIQNGG